MPSIFSASLGFFRLAFDTNSPSDLIRPLPYSAPMSWTLYRHAKGNPYLGLTTALHSESKEPHVVYRCLYANDLCQDWIRPQGMFEGVNERGERRFEPIARMRVVQPEEVATVLAFGFDAWGDDDDLTTFVARYDDNPNHLRGTRYLLETLDGEILCNLNTLRFQRGLMGIASVATSPRHRRQGWANLLLRAVMELLRLQEQGPMRFLLFSEVDPAIYRACGFRELPEGDQHFKPSHAMATGDLPLPSDEVRFVPRYF